MFTGVELTDALSKAGSSMNRKVSSYLIGGCAMTFMGRKVATKDIDVVFGSMPDAREFVSAMKQAGFSNVRKLSGEYDALGTFAMVEDNKGMRFDVFDRQVCKALEMSQGMRSHARFYRASGTSMCT